MEEGKRASAHVTTKRTRKHYRLKGQKVAPAAGFKMPKKESE
jgi:hypothetical protein